MKTKGEARCPTSGYVAIAGEVANGRSVNLRNVEVILQESASNPLLNIYEHR